MKRLLSSIFDGVAARTCAVCGASLVEGEEVMCLHCDIDAPRTMLHLNDFNSIHHRLGRTASPIIHACSWLYYYSDSPYANIVRSAKYGDRPALARAAARKYAKEIAGNGIFDDIDVILPVPMHWLKRLRRGYNQAEEVARGISDIIGLPVGDNLRALHSHATQTRRTLWSRASNIKGRFSLIASDELHGLNILIVDDIITTGATIVEAVRAITPAAPASISALSLGLTHLR